ncbi:hypothetical protein [Sphingobium sp. Ant17]|uniref:hypothetical protein n=1 Tax=Sphingobium sp. Ant17 TaxID=1461752 RepID=UPI000450CE2B|nr:hypothetical protein [Sphingobium sp. Ant17]EXS68382.1 hypothetical protein BF95_23150 [Sphingobium sp. Ant17]
MTGLQQPDEAECWAEARKLIDQYGDDVGPYLQMMIDVLMEEREHELFLKWVVIRNCVGMIVNSQGTTSQQ